MKKYNNYTSICNKCHQKGWHEKPEKCVRSYSKTCKECGHSIDGMTKCTGQNIMIDYSNISKQFIPYYENCQRIKVQYTYGKEKEVKSGTVEMTTGWKPVFILMLKSNSTGSSYILTDKEKII
jgi:hypothetical protein